MADHKVSTKKHSKYDSCSGTNETAIFGEVVNCKTETNPSSAIEHEHITRDNAKHHVSAMSVTGYQQATCRGITTTGELKFSIINILRKGI